jgi:hypothetical protein
MIQHTRILASSAAWMVEGFTVDELSEKMKATELPTQQLGKDDVSCEERSWAVM